MNQLIIDGNLCADPKFNQTEDGRDWSFFTIANNSVFFNKKEEKIEKVTFLDVIASRKGLQAYVKQYAKKGVGCVVLGRLEIIKTNKDGTNYTNVRLVADEIKFMKHTTSSDNNNNPPADIDDNSHPFN